MSLVRLFTGQINSGNLSAESIQAPPDTKKLLKRALLVYEGEFESMDGPVTVTQDHLLKLAANHNALIEHATLLAGSETPSMKDFPPLQLDHSTSAKDTIGRLIGKLEVAPHIRKDGKEVLGAYGNVLILGEENVEKVLDGRWTHLSVGVDFEKGNFSELTVTPFPAAPEASLLAKTEMPGKHIDEALWEKAKRAADEAGADDKYAFATWWYKHQGGKFSRFSKGDSMDEEMKAKFKKHLTGKKKMTEEEAEKHLAKCTEDEKEMKKLSAEVDEEEKKLAAEEEEKAKLAAAEEEEQKKLAAKKMKEEEEEKEKEEKEKKKKLSAAKSTLTRLSTDFRKNFEGAQLAAKKGTILTRLSKLRADAKVTPAEIKKMDIDKLSSQSQSTIDAVLKSYEDREPVIPVGAMGSIKAEDIGNLSKNVRMSRLEMETRSNMSLLKGTVKGDEKRLGSLPAMPSPEEVEIHIDATPHIEQEYEELAKMIDEGRTEELKGKLKGYLKKRLSSYRSSSVGQISSEETEKQLSALADSAIKMQTQFEELHKLAGSLVGL